MGRKVSRKFYLGTDTPAIAAGLLGTLLVVPDGEGRRVSGMIVETEAYCGVTDRAAHSFGGRRTQRNEVMYALGGSIYVFFVYGMYYQFNVVTGPVGHPHAILVRAVEPVDGIEIMRSRRIRRKRSKSGAATTEFPRNRDLTSGPGKLCIAFGIDREVNGEDLVGKKIWLEEYKSFSGAEIAVGSRVGIDYAGEDAERPWRFWVAGNDFVSKGHNRER